MMFNKILSLPLHVQILIALVLGTVIGLIFNPGEKLLDDATVTVQQSEKNGPVVIREVGAGDKTLFLEEIKSDKDEQTKVDEKFSRRWPSLAKLFRERQQNGELKLDVSNRRLRFSEDAKGIHATYTRQYGLNSVVSRRNFESGEQISQNFPEWKPVFDDFTSSASAKVMWISKTLGDLFLRLLKMITIPLIVSSLITGVTGLGNTSNLGSMFGRTMLYYVCTSVLAITTGIFMVNLISPGVGAELPGGGEGVLSGNNESLSGIFLGLVEKMIPSNPVQSLVAADFLSIITFSILFGVCILLVGGESAKRLGNFFNAFFEVMMRMTMAIIALAPIGVFAFMVYATASQGVEVFGTLAWYMIAVASALAVHACVILPLILYFVARRSPLEYARALSPALMTAFSTASSNGTLPLTMTCVEKRAGVSNKVSSFVLPLGATINMDGTALYEAVAVLFIAQATPGFDMSLTSQILVAVTALLASVGAAGIPHAGLVMMAIVLQAVGLPLEAQGIIIAVDRVLDMCRTTVNVWSDSCGCAVVQRFDQSVDSAEAVPADATPELS